MSQYYCDAPTALGKGGTPIEWCEWIGRPDEIIRDNHNVEYWTCPQCRWIWENDLEPARDVRMEM